MPVFSGTITRTAAATSGTEVITGLGVRPLIIFFIGRDNTDPNLNSMGFDDGINVGCYFSNTTTSTTAVGKVTQTQSIQVQTNAGAGWSAKITAVSSDGFTLTWTKIGAGRAITIKFFCL